MTQKSGLDDQQRSSPREEPHLESKSSNYPKH